MLYIFLLHECGSWFYCSSITLYASIKCDFHIELLTCGKCSLVVTLNTIWYLKTVFSQCCFSLTTCCFTLESVPLSLQKGVLAINKQIHTWKVMSSHSKIPYEIPYESYHVIHRIVWRWTLFPIILVNIPTVFHNYSLYKIISTIHHLTWLLLI